jgi:hypothetical protein
MKSRIDVVGIGLTDRLIMITRPRPANRSGEALLPQPARKTPAS